MTLNRGVDQATTVKAVHRLFDLLIKSIGFEGRVFGLKAWGL